jgi:hypothetical protein
VESVQSAAKPIFREQKSSRDYIVTRGAL